jgi:hypothetical protein
MPFFLCPNPLCYKELKKTPWNSNNPCHFLPAFFDWLDGCLQPALPDPPGFAAQFDFPKRQKPVISNRFTPNARFVRELA